MEIKQPHLQKFIMLYEKEFGIVLSPFEAQPKLFALIEFARLCRMPIAKAEENDINVMPD